MRGEITKDDCRSQTLREATGQTQTRARKCITTGNRNQPTLLFFSFLVVSPLHFKGHLIGVICPLGVKHNLIFVRLYPCQYCHRTFVILHHHDVNIKLIFRSWSHLKVNSCSITNSDSVWIRGGISKRIVIPTSETNRTTFLRHPKGNQIKPFQSLSLETYSFPSRA